MDVQPVCKVRSDTISRDAIRRFVHGRGGTVTFADNADVTVNSRVAMTCGAGHSWSCIAGCITRWCSVCRILGMLRQGDPHIVCAQTEFYFGQEKFEFVCHHGHRFYASDKNCGRGCRSCAVLNSARNKHDKSLALDTKCVYVHAGSRLRFHCRKLRHNPSCQNPECVRLRADRYAAYKHSPDCDNYVPCAQDFYATPAQIRKCADVYNCDDNHRWFYANSYSDIFISVRVFETQFSARFDDIVRDTPTNPHVEFTGYNEELKIAFTHARDRVAFQHIRAARRWAMFHGVRFFFIEADITGGKYIAAEVIRQLREREVKCPNPISMQFLRGTIKRMDRENKLFEDRCCF